MYGAAEATARMSYLKYEFAKKKIEVLQVYTRWKISNN